VINKKSILILKVNSVGLNPSQVGKKIVITKDVWGINILGDMSYFVQSGQEGVLTGVSFETQMDCSLKELFHEMKIQGIRLSVTSEYFREIS